MPRRLLKVEEGNFEEVILAAARAVISGGVVAVPTESFYGLAVNALDKEAISRLLEIKKRSEDHPILILISSADDLSSKLLERKDINPILCSQCRTFRVNDDSMFQTLQLRHRAEAFAPGFREVGA
jgi:tRNA A37 threonylcarbamoyladenosine synthetase subunit TsaC/SUA5/YrdC